jgi:hypothetical protein
VRHGRLPRPRDGALHPGFGVAGAALPVSRRWHDGVSATPSWTPVADDAKVLEGEVPEWLIGPLQRAARRRASVGSNPTLSASRRTAVPGTRPTHTASRTAAALGSALVASRNRPQPS